MGPRVRTRGDSRPVYNARVYATLQWGRAFARAEILQGGVASEGCVRLQWGRAFARAEMSLETPARWYISALQWGRAFARAEIIRR